MEIEKEIFDNVEDALPDEFAHLSVEGIAQRARLLENELRVLRDETQRLTIEQGGLKEKIKENKVRHWGSCNAGLELPCKPMHPVFRALYPRYLSWLCFAPLRVRAVFERRRKSSSTTSCHTWWAMSSRCLTSSPMTTRKRTARQ